MEHSLDWDKRQTKALTVACLVSYCQQPEGKECVDQDGNTLNAQPAHPQREIHAAAMTCEQPMFLLGELPEPVDAAPPAPKAKGALSKLHAECEHCGKPLLWAITRLDNAMPLDAEPNPERGNVLVTEEAGRLRAAVIGKRSTADAMRKAGERMHVHHVVTCAYASRWRTSTDRRTR